MNITIQHIFGQSASTVVIPLIQDGGLERPLQAIAEGSGIAYELIANDFKANFKEVHTLYIAKEDSEVKRIYLLGLGMSPNFAKVQLAFRSFGHHYKRKLTATIGVDFIHHPAEKLGEWIEAAINGLVLSQYDLALYHTNEKTAHPVTDVVLYTKADYQNIVEKAIDRGVKTGETQMEIFDLVNRPANKLTAKDLSDWAVASGKKYGYRTMVIGKTQAKELGLHALLAVNRGSEEPPYFVIMEYTSPNATADTPVFGLVGKGVTYDTGGLSIKTAGMHYMKSDMGGAAAVVGAMELTAKLELPIKLVGIVPTTDNCVDANAIKPGDVIDSYSGKTIEVIDTDAEGRLILADGLAYICKHFQPDVLVDLATLTGSAVRALGPHAAALFATTDELATRLYDAGQQVGERIWRLPLWEEYGDMMKSDIADIKNLSARPLSGAITAAKFLQFFTDNHPNWAHIDVASMAYGDSEFGKQKHGTAFGVRLLTTFFENYLNA